MPEPTTYPELTPDPALSGAERVDDLLNRAEAYMTHPNPLRVNFAALRAGQVWTLLRRKAADKETHRKGFQLKITEDLIANGIPGENGETVKLAKTAAADHARADKRYTDYVDEQRAVEERRDRAKVLWKSLHQRAAVLAGGEVDHDFDDDDGGRDER